MPKYVDLDERVDVTYYDDMQEEWTSKTNTIGECLYAVTDGGFTIHEFNETPSEQYIVMVLHSFDAETSAYTFDDYEDAKSYLEWLWQEYYNEEIANDSALIESECYHEDEYARVTWTDDEYTEFILTSITHKLDERWCKERCYNE